MSGSNDFTRALDAALVAATCLSNAVMGARKAGQPLDPTAILAMTEASTHAHTLAYRLRDASDIQREALAASVAGEAPNV